MRSPSDPPAADLAASPWALHGVGDPQVIVAGHSHVVCVLAAVESPLLSGEEHGVAVAYRQELSAGPPSGLEYWDFVAAQSENRVVAVMFNGNQHQANFLIAGALPLAVWSPAHPRFPEGSIPVARSRLRAFFRPTLDELADALVVLTSGRLRREVMVLATPPPKRDEEVRANLGRERFFAPIAEAQGIALEDLKVTPQETRLAMWDIIQDLLQEVAKQFGVAFLPVPPGMQDGNGYLVSAASGPDATHANAIYGEAVVRQLHSALRR